MGPIEGLSYYVSLLSIYAFFDYRWDY